MTQINFEMENLIDRCKGCGCLTLECVYCINNIFYRHIDDKVKMKQNLKIILEAIKILLI